MQLFKKSQKVIWAFTAAALLSVLPIPTLAGKSEPLPEIDKIATSLNTSEDAVEMMYVSAVLKIPDELKSKLTSQVDVLKVEIDAMWDLINDKSVPNSEKEITYVRYTMGDKRVDEALIAALKAGINVKILTDVNPVMSYSKFKKGEKFTIDFANAELKNGGKGSGPETVARLLAGGFVFDKNLFSQPLYNPDENDRTPIMHEKALLLRAGKKLISFLSTTNAAPHVRFNRIFKIVLDALYSVYYDHANSLIENYKAGKETKELASAHRKQFDFSDGTFIQLAFTDGKFNPNDRIVDAINNGDVTDWLLSEFAPTNWNVMNALGTKMTKDTTKSIKGFIISDVKFTNNYGFGLTSTLSNYGVYSQFVNHHGFGEGVADRVNASVWHQAAIDPDTGKPMFQTEEDGAPNYAVLWHDKTTILKYKNGLYDMFSGSFNLSNNVVNAENQVQFRLRQNSVLAAATDFSVRETVRTNPQYAIPITESMITSTLAKTFKIGDLDIAAQDVKDLVQAVRDQHQDAIVSLLNKISQSPTHMKAPLSNEERASRIDKFTKFLGWYYKALPQWKDPLIGLKHVLAVGLIIANDKMSIGTRVAILRDAVWRPNVTPDDLQKYLEQAYEELGYGKLPPPPAKRPEDDTKKKPKGVSTDADDQHGDSEAGTTAPVDADHIATVHPVINAPVAAPAASVVSASFGQNLVAKVSGQIQSFIAPFGASKPTLPALPSLQPVPAPKSGSAAPVASKPVFPAPPVLKPVPAPAAPAPVVVAPPAAPAPAPVDAGAPGMPDGVRDLRFLDGISPTDVVLFDFDNTIMNLPTKIRLFKKGSEAFIDVSSAEYAVARKSIGFANGKFADYEVRKGGAKKDDSFVHFSDKSFRSDVKAALAQPDHGFAPGIWAWVERLRNPRTAARSYTETARLHDPEVVMTGLREIKSFLKKTYGITIFLPAKSHIIEVGYAADVPQEKAKRAIELIGKLKSLSGLKKVVLLDDDANNVSALNEAGASPLNKKALRGLKLSGVQVLPSGPVRNVIAIRPPAPPRVLMCKDLFH